MKPIICMGFIFPDLACSRSIDSAREDEGDGGLAASDRIGHRRGGFGSVARDCALANGTGEPGRAGADAAGLPGKPVVFCSGAGGGGDRKSTRLNSSHANISYAVFCLKKTTVRITRPRESHQT